MSESSQKATVSVSERRYKNGDLARYEIVNFESWEHLYRVFGRTDADIVKEITRLFQANILPGKTTIGPVILFTVPEGTIDPFQTETEIGFIVNQERRIKYWLTKALARGEFRIEKGNYIFDNSKYESFWESLTHAGMTGIAKINRGYPVLLPLYRDLGTLIDHSKNSIVFNSHFFQMETTDCDTPWDIMGEPFGLLILDGKILLPPLFEREAFFIGKTGNSWIGRPSLRDVEVYIGSTGYIDGYNCRFFSRPAIDRTSKSEGTDLIIVGKHVVGLHDGGCTEIPEGGFIIQTYKRCYPDSFDVDYLGFNNVAFAVQVGPALVREGKAAVGFGPSPFWNGLGPTFPPSVYPLDWERGRAARLGLGSKDGRLLLIWIEGSNKLSYRKGVDSCGASLAEFAQICIESGVKEFVSLDGGGSAQICIDGGRLLRLSDRYPHSGKDAERPLPFGLAFDLV